MAQGTHPVVDATEQAQNRPIPAAVDELHYLIRAQYKMIYVVSAEEGRVERWIQELAHLDKPALRERWMCTNWNSRQFIAWSCSQGFQSNSLDVPGDIREPIRCLDWIGKHLTKDAVVVLRDFHPFLNDPMVARRVRDLVHHFDGETVKRTVIFLSSVVKIPMELEKDIQVVDFDLPDRDTMVGIVREKAWNGSRSTKYGKNFNYEEAYAWATAKSAQLDFLAGKTWKKGVEQFKSKDMRPGLGTYKWDK